MDKIHKFLMKLTSKQQDVILRIMHDIKANNLQHLQIKKLVNEDNMYRVRVWSIRVIFKVTSYGNSIINIDFRGNIYK